MTIGRVVSIGVVPLLAACSAGSAVVPSGEASANFTSQEAADAALLQFASKEPDCQLWTNWQKLCVRRASAGPGDCRVDADYPVAPSTPFCIAGTTRADVLNPQELLSARRFCENLGDDDLAGPNRNRIPRICSRYALKKPFNSRSLAAVRDRWCEVWSDVKTQEPVCGEGEAAPGLPRCDALAKRIELRTSQLYCSRQPALFGSAPTREGCWELSTAAEDDVVRMNLRRFPRESLREVVRPSTRIIGKPSLTFTAPYCASWKKII